MRDNLELTISLLEYFSKVSLENIDEIDLFNISSSDENDSVTVEYSHDDSNYLILSIDKDDPNRVNTLVRFDSSFNSTEFFKELSFVAQRHDFDILVNSFASGPKSSKVLELEKFFINNFYLELIPKKNSNYIITTKSYPSKCCVCIFINNLEVACFFNENDVFDFLFELDELLDEAKFLVSKIKELHNNPSLLFDDDRIKFNNFNDLFVKIVPDLISPKTKFAAVVSDRAMKTVYSEVLIEDDPLSQKNIQLLSSLINEVNNVFVS